MEKEQRRNQNTNRTRKPDGELYGHKYTPLHSRPQREKKKKKPYQPILYKYNTIKKGKKKNSRATQPREEM